MRKIILVVMIKKYENGLLSIVENRTKSMIPLLGDAKLIDFYLYPGRLNKFYKILINIKNDSIKIKDYINYHYREHPIRLIIGDNLFDNILKIIRREKAPVLIVQADGFLDCNWDLLIDELFDFKKDNTVISYSKGNNVFEAIYINDREAFYDLIKELKTSAKDDQNYDNVWERLISLSIKNYNKMKVESIEDYNGLRTVKEYYDFHINLLKDMERCFKYTSMFQGEVSKEKTDITVAANSVVKNSYISSSSYIEGEIEESFIFSNVKVSKGAYIYRSIVMNNNNIGENARLERIILSDGGEFQTVLPRINERAILGGRTEGGFNKDFPDYIYDGISLIGSNVDIPRGFILSENCYISSNTGKLILKEKKKLLNGESLIKQINKM